MKLAIVTLGMMKIDLGKFYNAQDVGLALALAEYGNEVDVYNFVDKKIQSEEKKTKLGQGVFLHQLPSKSFGVHSLYRKDFLENDCQGVICFSDNQINFKHIVNICRKRNIPCLPYVGVLGSNNGNPIKGIIMNVLANNEKLYKDMVVLAKTPDVKEKMNALGIGNVTVAPVCLDVGMLKGDYEKYSKEELKQELKVTGKMLLFVGRLQPEKQPLDMIDIFNDVVKKDEAYSLVFIGKGPMENQVKERIQELKLQDKITFLSQVKNSEMWKYYRACDAIINLNFHEIFGMTILEAMFYEARVIAIHAPGPDFIIEGRAELGSLCSDFSGIVNEIMRDDGSFDGKRAHKHIEDNFMWKSTAKNILDKLTM